MNPGGWVEFHDLDCTFRSDDGTLDPNSETVKWQNQQIRGSLMVGLDPNPGNKLHGYIKNAGFVNIKERIVKLPWYVYLDTDLNLQRPDH